MARLRNPTTGEQVERQGGFERLLRKRGWVTDEPEPVRPSEFQPGALPESLPADEAETPAPEEE